MKNSLGRKTLALTALLVVLSVAPAWPQVLSARVDGRVTQGDAPAAKLQVVFTEVNTAKQYKLQTDKKGQFFLVGMSYGTYKVQFLDASGKVLCTRAEFAVSDVQDHELSVDLSKPEASGCMTSDAAEAKSQPVVKITKEQQKAEAARIKAINDKIAGLNPVIMQAQSALQAQKWAEAETALKKILAADPDTTRWDFYKALADAQSHSEKYQDSIKSYEKGVSVAQAVAAGTAPKDPLDPNPDAARATIGIGQMLTSQGNAYVKIDKFDEAVASFTKAAQAAPNPAVAYYNLCAVEFNINKMDDAIAACEKSLAANPANADAWFLKGTALYKTAKTDNGKVSPRPGTADALNKYLELDPNGTHVGEAKSILQNIAQK